MGTLHFTAFATIWHTDNNRNNDQREGGNLHVDYGKNGQAKLRKTRDCMISYLKGCGFDESTRT